MTSYNIGDMAQKFLPSNRKSLDYEGSISLWLICWSTLYLGVDCIEKELDIEILPFIVESRSISSFFVTQSRRRIQNWDNH